MKRIAAILAVFLLLSAAQPAHAQGWSVSKQRVYLWAQHAQVLQAITLWNTLSSGLKVGHISEQQFSQQAVADYHTIDQEWYYWDRRPTQYTHYKKQEGLLISAFGNMDAVFLAAWQIPLDNGQPAFIARYDYALAVHEFSQCQAIMPPKK